MADQNLNLFWPFWLKSSDFKLLWLNFINFWWILKLSIEIWHILSNFDAAIEFDFKNSDLKFDQTTIRIWIEVRTDYNFQVYSMA